MFDGEKPYNKVDWFQLLFKVFIFFLSFIVIYGVYLDQKIRNRIDGKVWHLPAAVYGRMIDLEPGISSNKNEIIKLLESTKYRQVSKITHPGEFSIQKNSIEMIRRPFDFPENKEGEIRARLIFDNNHLETIENMKNNRRFSFLRLDPCLITMLSSQNGEERLFMKRNDFPDLLIDILLTVEDRHFYKHDGISWYSIGRAMLINLTSRKTIQGASTLTQQLVKNLFLSNKRSYWRKINEIYMAILMEARYSKDRILELYMNEVYLGQNGDNAIRGFPLASLYYFNRPIGELSLHQQALLVGMIKGASFYNPWRNPKLAMERRNLVLLLLKHQKIISQDMYNTLSICPLDIQSQKIISPHPSLIQIVRQELQNKFGNKIKDFSGIKIFTTFDPINQQAAEQAVIDGIPLLKKQKKLDDLETAMVVVDRYSGELRAIIGGAEPKYAGYNRAIQARRSIGSLAKPITYLTALDKPNQYRLNTWIADIPISLRQFNGEIWSPQNDDHQFRGKIMLLDAFIHSINVPTVNLGMALGLPAIIDMWKKLGVPKEQLFPVPAMILGALNLTPIEIAQAFQTIASGGNRASLSVIRSVVSPEGKVLYHSYPQAERVISPQSAYITLWIMQQVIQHGTGRHLGEIYPNLHLAGKTGTTNNNIDAWFVGMDGREVTIVWVGRDNNQSTKLYGSNGAMVIYQRYLKKQFPVPLNLIPPADIINIGINDIGNFVCSNSIRSLPVWTTNSKENLCQRINFKKDNLLD